MSQVSITNVINVQVNQAGLGLGEYNTSNIGHFTAEPYAESFGSLGYKLYKSPRAVGVDFGTDSLTYQMAVACFSQKPNILANGGYFAVLPLVVEVQRLAFSAGPASGSYVINFGGHASAAVNWNDTADQIQTKVQAIIGLEQATIAGTAASHVDIAFYGYYGPAALVTITSNTLNASITVTPSQITDGEALSAAITRTDGIVQYFGVEISNNLLQADLLAAAAVIQALNKIGFFIGVDEADVQAGGKLDLLRTGSFSQSRGLFYGSDITEPLVMQAAFAGRMLCVNFDGSNTTINMNLKTLEGVQPDLSIDDSLLTVIKASGAACYPSIQGVSKVIDSGTNVFPDAIYNQLWFAGAISIAYFNYLAQTATKIPQTESGMSGAKSAIRVVCKKAIANQMGAPGVWTSPDTFGVLEDFLANIEQYGYYIFSEPIALQSPDDREDRVAPVIQVALKLAGGFNTGFVIVNLNS